MKCKFIIFLIALTSWTHTAKSQNNITLSVDVEKIPEMGFVISYLKESMIGMDFDAKGHAEYRIEDMDVIYLTLHNGFAEQKTIYAEKGDHIQLSFDGESMKKTLKMEGARKHCRLLEERENIMARKQGLRFRHKRLCEIAERESKGESTIVRQPDTSLDKGKQ